MRKMREDPRNWSTVMRVRILGESVIMTLITKLMALWHEGRGCGAKAEGGHEGEALLWQAGQGEAVAKGGGRD